jgi:DNA-binding transcriptional LysR family regulator
MITSSRHSFQLSRQASNSRLLRTTWSGAKLAELYGVETLREVPILRTDLSRWQKAGYIRTTASGLDAAGRTNREPALDTIVNIKTFMTIADAGSFSKAARELGVATSVVTKRVEQLEWQTKATLFHRSTRRLQLTEAGQRFLPMARRAAREVDEALGSLTDDSLPLEGHLRVKVPTGLCIFYIRHAVAEFLKLHPEISIDLVTRDRPINPVTAGYDIAINTIPMSYNGVSEIALVPLARCVAAAPDYLKTHGVPTQPTDLVKHDILNFSPTGSIWSFIGDHGPIDVELAPRFATNNVYALLSATIEGNGIALLSAYVCRAEFSAGRLMPLLSDYKIPQLWARVLVATERLSSPKVKSFISHLERAGRALDWALSSSVQGAV